MYIQVVYIQHTDIHENSTHIQRNNDKWNWEPTRLTLLYYFISNVWYKFQHMWQSYDEEQSISIKWKQMVTIHKISHFKWSLKKLYIDYFRKILYKIIRSYINNRITDKIIIKKAMHQHITNWYNHLHSFMVHYNFLPGTSIGQSPLLIAAHFGRDTVTPIS